LEKKPGYETLMFPATINHSLIYNANLLNGSNFAIN